jgi:hypothetical protein
MRLAEVAFSAEFFAEIVAGGESARLCLSDSLRLAARLPTPVEYDTNPIGFGHHL